MDVVKERLVQYAKIQGIAIMDFYKKISIAQSNFSGKGADSSLSTDKIIQILMVFPEISPDWLLLGKGEMLRSTVTSESQICADKDKKIFQLQEKYITLLERYNHLVEERVPSPASPFPVEEILS